MAGQGPTYAQTGVDYSAMDPIKVLAQQRAQQTANNLTSFDAHEMTASRGESAYVWEEHDAYRALVIEGLGTKNLIADAVRTYTGKTHYDTIAKDAVAMIVNDLIVVGALPQVVNAYFAIGDSNWMLDKERASDLINGWAAACQESGATWGGGETPTLKGIINPETIDLGGSAVGIINPKEHLVLGDKLAADDAIVLIESSGIHANGITFVRTMAERDPDLYQTKLSNGQTFGEALLHPTHLYVNLVKNVLAADIAVHYMVNITGHGWRKLMRATKEFSYIMHQIPEPQPEFVFMQTESGTDDREMYGNFNMGAGFAIFVPQADAEKVVAIAKAQQLNAWVAGKVQAGPKQVIIEPKNITFAGETLEVR
jgi:phosphoribosylformylglycinamidine cyclo-ligase